MGGLLQMVQRRWAWAGCAVPSVTAHPSTDSVPTSYYSMWHYNCLGTLKSYPVVTIVTSIATATRILAYMFQTALSNVFDFQYDITSSSNQMSNIWGRAPSTLVPPLVITTTTLVSRRDTVNSICQFGLIYDVRHSIFNFSRQRRQQTKTE